MLSRRELASAIAVRAEADFGNCRRDHRLAILRTGVAPDMLTGRAPQEDKETYEIVF
jgi:hypothetical protein